MAEKSLAYQSPSFLPQTLAYPKLFSPFVKMLCIFTKGSTESFWKEGGVGEGKLFFKKVSLPHRGKVLFKKVSPFKKGEGSEKTI